jgi:hypothetical protein
MFIPKPYFFYPGSRIQGRKDPGSAFATKNLSIFNQKTCYLSSLKFFPPPGSRGQKSTRSRIRSNNIGCQYLILFLICSVVHAADVDSDWHTAGQPTATEPAVSLPSAYQYSFNSQSSMLFLLAYKSAMVLPMDH